MPELDPAAQAAALSMRQRAANVAMTRGAVPCLWLPHSIASDILALPLAETRAVPTADLESLRQEIVAGCERIIAHRLGVSARDRQVAAAQAKFWAGASTEELQRLYDLFAHYQEIDP